jgi:hypothetical protein
MAPYLTEAAIIDYLNYVYPRANWRQIAKNPRLSREFIAHWIKFNRPSHHYFYAHTNAPLAILQHVMDSHTYYETLSLIPPIKFEFVKKYVHANPNYIHYYNEYYQLYRYCLIFKRWNILIPTKYTRQYICESTTYTGFQQHPNFYIEDHPDIKPLWFILSSNPNLTHDYITQHITKWS